MRQSAGEQVSLSIKRNSRQPLPDRDRARAAASAAQIATFDAVSSLFSPLEGEPLADAAENGVELSELERFQKVVERSQPERPLREVAGRVSGHDHDVAEGLAL